MYCHIDQLALWCFWKDVQDIKNDIALNLVSPVSITSLIFLRPGFWIPIKDILSQPKVDWPCQDFSPRVN